MSGAGWGAAYGAMGIDDALKEALLREERRKQQEFNNQLALRQADRQDTELQQRGELHQSQLAASGDARLQSGREMLTPGSFLSDAQAEPYTKGPLVGTLRQVPGMAAKGADYQGPQEDGTSPEQAMVGRPGGYFTQPTQKQAQAQDMSEIKAWLAQIAQQRANTGDRTADTGEKKIPIEQQNADSATQNANTNTNKVPILQQTADVAKQNADTRAKNPSGGVLGNSGGAPLTPEGVDLAADLLIDTGAYPPLGMGNGDMRKAIINRAAEKLRGGRISANKAEYGADAKALAALTTQRHAIGAFEETAQENINVFLETAGNIVDLGSPFINQPVRAISGTLLGSKNQAAYDAARDVALVEISKIVNNPTLSGQLSDSARTEVMELNKPGATLGQTVRVMRLLQRDMANRKHSLDNEIGAIRQRLRKPGAPSGGAPDLGGGGKSDPMGIR